MAVSGPNTPENISASIRSQMAAGDTVYSFQFGTDPTSDNYWGFNGSLVARGDCIIHVSALGYDN
jgi:hypothetical protein